MEKNDTKTASLWTTLKLFFANDVENSKEFQDELENLQKEQARIHNERKRYGASLVVPSKDLSKSVSKYKKVEKKQSDKSKEERS